MRTYVVMPHLIRDEETLNLALCAIKSFNDTKPDCFIVSVIDGIEQTRDEWVKAIMDSSSKTVILHENSGFAAACNRGFESVLEELSPEDEDDWIVCANNDIRVFRGWWDAMTEPFTQFKNVGVTGLPSCKALVVEGSLPLELRQRRKITEGGLLDGWMQSGGLWMSKTQILRKVGLFDERFRRGGYEDVDLFLRFRDSYGYKIVMTGMSFFWHKEGHTRWNPKWDEGKWARECKKTEDKNAELFREKWGFGYYDRQVWRETVLWQD